MESPGLGCALGRGHPGITCANSSFSILEMLNESDYHKHMSNLEIAFVICGHYAAGHGWLYGT